MAETKPTRCDRFDKGTFKSTEELEQHLKACADCRAASESTAVAEYELPQDSGLIRKGYVPWASVQTSLPLRNPGPVEAWVRHNGRFLLTIESGRERDKQGQVIKHFGIPFGVYPRLILPYLTTYAVQRRQRRIPLGSSLRDTLKAFGITYSGSKQGPQVRDQLKRLITSHWTIQNTSEDERLNGFCFSDVGMIEDAWLPWEPRDHPDQLHLEEGWVLLRDRWFDHLIKHPIPINLETLAKIARSPLSIDIYEWACHRMFYTRQETPIHWASLAMQFGVQDSRIWHFKQKFLEAAQRVKNEYPGFNYRWTNEHFILLPGRPEIAPPKVF